MGGGAGANGSGGGVGSRDCGWIGWLDSRVELLVLAVLAADLLMSVFVAMTVVALAVLRR